jgi:hypothetical protein
MVRTPTIPRKDWEQVANLYISGLPMRSVAERLKISIDVVTYVLRKLKVPRRSVREASRLAYEVKNPSYTIKKEHTPRALQLNLAGAMLYWAEGYKRDTASGIDFANSDPAMVSMFLQFLRSRYSLDMDRLHCSIYCYKNQELGSLVKFWSRTLKLSENSFKNHYVKQDFKVDSRQLPYGGITYKVQ